MKQRLTINEEGRIVLHMNNGEYCEGDWSGKIAGDFLISTEDIVKLLVDKNGEIIQVDEYIYSNYIGLQGCKKVTIISKENLSQMNEELEERYKKDVNDCIEKFTNKLSSFNSLPFWKKAFYIFKI